ncbi:unnamed protein product (macronuclear) [Paramecium tetraurelia]|uniref:Transmembrane protein n=1 Tax=Paramecium tetraurelia TaxID=5888 RepID=A0D4U0_PARTE|nr:uncharacterized protein GSPATT00013504001 [Paramecium tetraurelia]CAK78057.1 unnamed protein product [Paramecium tetraurelia]|eukprot:XP_001445454.1 hypothetical protein (macronuclear) [Paramecium tetraurelia strain d4-2]
MKTQFLSIKLTTNNLERYRVKVTGTTIRVHFRMDLKVVQEVGIQLTTVSFKVFLKMIFLMEKEFQELIMKNQMLSGKMGNYRENYEYKKFINCESVSIKFYFIQIYQSFIEDCTLISYLSIFLIKYYFIFNKFSLQLCIS